MTGGPDADLERRRDPETIRAYLPRLAFFFEHWHRVSIEGLERVPEGAALLVGNHNGGAMSPDMFALMVAWWRHHGVDSRAYGLMHDLPFRIPFAGDLMARFGAVPARPANAIELLRRGARVLVYPGGDFDAYRPWSKRGEIVFGPRTGFVRVALRTGAPIVPVVSSGAHDGFRVLTDGRAIVERLGLKRRARLEVFPIALCLPWGVTFGPAVYLPLPVDIRIRVLPALQWPELPAEAADDEGVVWRCREQVRETMQKALDDMERDRR
jgi:1-acyl-sn-glycerol-3-phosphate acyltransferase